MSSSVTHIFRAKLREPLARAGERVYLLKGHFSWQQLKSKTIDGSARIFSKATVPEKTATFAQK